MRRNLPLEGKITIFKSLALSKIVYLALLTIVPKSIIEELNEIQNEFLWSNKKCKIKYGTLCNDYKNGSLKNLDINLKINESQYIELFEVSGSIKKFFSIDCVNINFSQSIAHYLFSIDCVNSYLFSIKGNNYLFSIVFQ